MKHSCLIIIALAVCCGGTVSSFGADIVNNTWLDGVRTDPASPIYAENNGVVGVDADADGDRESAFLKGGAGTLTSAPGVMTGSGFGASSASWYTYFTPEATPVTLANAGDQLRLTWAFTPNGVNTANTSQGFNVALVQTPAATRVTADASVPSAAYKGYAVFMNMGQTLGNSNPFRLMEWNTAVASGALLGTSGNWTGLANGATSGNDGYDSGTLYTLELTLTRNAAAGLDILASMIGGTLNNTGTNLVSFTDPTPSSFTYDTFDIRPSNEANSATSIDSSRFRVEVNQVPEPSSIVLSGLVLAGMLIRRSRTPRY